MTTTKRNAVIRENYPDAAIGYAPNAESRYTRRVSGGSSGEVVMSLRAKQSLNRLDKLILDNIRDLEKIERKIVCETDPVRAAKLVAQQEIKMQFILRLRVEQQAGIK